jgi:phosphate transport system substrate-binding protein
MKKYFYGYSIFFLFLMLTFVACNKLGNANENQETILKGSTTILVDESLKPIVEDQVAVFESKYDAKIRLDAKSEKEVLLSFLKDTSSIIVLSRPLDSNEIKTFQKRKVIPKVTKFATDAIALILNKRNNDTLIDLKAVVAFMKGDLNTKIKGLVFDNPNSSSVRYMNQLAGLKQTPAKGIFSFKTNEEVIQFVSENEGMIGVVGVNWLMQPTPAMEKSLANINVLNVRGLEATNYYAPTQNNLAEGTYPLTRDLYLINCQGFSGLGMGFASFIAGDIGQRIVLKSGLLPVQMPGRNIIIRKEIEKTKK